MPHALAIGGDLPAGTVVEHLSNGEVRTRLPANSPAVGDELAQRIESGELVLFDDACRELGVKRTTLGYLGERGRVEIVYGPAYWSGHRLRYVTRASLNRELARRSVGDDEMTLSEAAELLGVSREALQARIHRGTLWGRRAEHANHGWLVKRSVVEREHRRRWRREREEWLDTPLSEDVHAQEAMEHVGGPMDCEAIGRLFGCSGETIRQILIGALAKLQDVPEAAELLELAREREGQRSGTVEPESFELGEVRTKLKGRATVTGGNWGTFAPQGARRGRRLQVMQDHPRTREVFSCEALSARLTLSACAARWERAASKDYLEYLEPCRGCAQGEANVQALSSEKEAHS